MPTISSHADRAALTRILAELARSLPSGEITVRFNQARVSDNCPFGSGSLQPSSMRGTPLTDG